MVWRQVFLTYWEGEPDETSLPESGDLPLAGFVPPMDILERDETLVIELELPGVNPAGLRLEMTERTLVIQGVKAEEPMCSKRYVRAERCFGPFRRTLVLPEEFSGFQTRAEMSNGILRVIVPRPSRSTTVVVEGENTETFPLREPRGEKGVTVQ